MTPLRTRRRPATRLVVSLVLALGFGTAGQHVLAQQVEPAPPPQVDRVFEISPRAYVQFDWRGYPDWTVSPGTGRLRFDTLQVRRLRMGIDGRWRRLSYEFTLDPQDTDDTLVADAYAQVRFNRALRLRGGQFKVPGSREYGTAARNLDFMERSALAESIAPGRDIGAMVTGEMGARFEYSAGLFAGDGNGRGSRAGLTTAARVVFTVATDLEAGASFSEGRTTAVDTDAANGFDGRAPSGYRFFERLYVDGRRTRIGGDAAWTPGRWAIIGEVLRANDERAGQGLDLEDLPSVVGMGWSAAVTRQFGRRQGQSRIRIREFEIGLRADALSFDDNGPATPSDSVRPRATDVRARGVKALTAGVSWSPTRWVRVMGNAGLERYTESRSAPEAGKSGSYWTLGTRLQVELP